VVASLHLSNVWHFSVVESSSFLSEKLLLPLLLLNKVSLSSGEVLVVLDFLVFVIEL
jgi:hypothetical protein